MMIDSPSGESTHGPDKYSFIRSMSRNENHMHIYGAGLAGLLCANMLRRFQPTIYEAQASLPNNHDALLRFRTDAVSRATGIPFKKVIVNKSIYFNHRHFSSAALNMNNMYSYKVTGEYSARSIMNTKTCERWIAPPDFISQMARSCNIVYSAKKQLLDDIQHGVECPKISTIPMPVLLRILKNIAEDSLPTNTLLRNLSETEIKFKWRPIWAVNINLEGFDLYQTVYYPEEIYPFYRASFTGTRLIVEYSKQPSPKDLREHISQILNSFGVWVLNQVDFSTAQIHYQEYGKLTPILDGTRKRFITECTDKIGIYSLGRFSTWRQILLDEVVQDVSIIESWIIDKNSYKRRLDSGKGAGN